MAPDPPPLAVTRGTLLGGRVRYDQPATGHRSGIEPVLLAASVPASPGERVLEGGTGAGAGLLCLAGRVGALEGLGVELDAGTAELARRNIAANGWDRLSVLTADLALATAALAAAGPFDHAFANPPWHDGPASAEPRRALARTVPLNSVPAGSVPTGATLLAAWVGALAAPLRRGGTLTVVLPAARLGDAIAALADWVGALQVLPLWPHAGQAAKLVLLRGRRGRAGADTILPGLVLHGREGGYSEGAEQVLRHGAAVTWE